MAIPDYQAIMLPLLKLSGDRKEHSLREAIDILAERFALTDDERRELLPSGQQARFDNRVAWARTYLKKAGLVVSTRRGYFQITDRGAEVLQENVDAINVGYLKKFPEFLEFNKRSSETPALSDSSSGSPDDQHTPEEDIEAAYQALQRDLSTELLQIIQTNSPSFFERLVIDLLVKMGYGGTRKDAGQAIGKSGDEGIDGMIKEDRLGLDIVYIQAKRWENAVGRPEIQKFAGALQGQRAKKGIFITTSSFTEGAREFVSKIESKIVLIDGDMLAQLMIDYNIGVTTIATYDLKRVDSDYFTEE